MKSSNEPLIKLPSDVSKLTSLQMSTLAGQLLIAATESEDLLRPGLVRTPERFAKAMKVILAGYSSSPKNVVGEGVFPAESGGLVSVNQIEFFSLCEHHMLPFWGHVSVAYYPNKKIVGLSKIPRIVELFSRRLQVQERLTQQIADTLFEVVGARAVAVRISGQHLCMMMRGVEKQNSHTISEATNGLKNITDIEQQRLYAVLETKGL